MAVSLRGAAAAPKKSLSSEEMEVAQGRSVSQKKNLEAASVETSLGEESKSRDGRSAAGLSVDAEKALFEEEEVGEPPRLPSEPCFARPEPFRRRVRRSLRNLLLAAGAIVAAGRSLMLLTRGGHSASPLLEHEASPGLETPLPSPLGPSP